MQSRETSKQIADRYGNLLTVKRITVLTPSGEQTELVPAVAGKSILATVVDIVNGGASSDFSLSSDNGDSLAAVYPPVHMGAGVERIFSRNVDGWFQTYLGESLSALNGAGAATVTLNYVETVDGADRAPGEIAFPTDEQTEGSGAHTATITVNRSGGTDGVVSAEWATANGTATAGVNYTADSDTVTFADGVATAAINVDITTGGVSQLDFTITLTNPEGGATLGGQDEILVRIDAL